MSAAAAAIARDTGAALALDAEARKYELEQAITWAARRFREFTADHVRAWLDGKGLGDLAHPNAVGGVFLAASRAGVIESTDSVRRSCRNTSKRRKLTVWRSRIFQGEA